MELNSSKPIYIQIKEYYEKLIDSGLLKEGQEMPSVREIAIAHGINPNTVQRALTLMVVRELQIVLCIPMMLLKL